jgi:hypothetical protein
MTVKKNYFVKEEKQVNYQNVFTSPWILSFCCSRICSDKWISTVVVKLTECGSD